jgi:CMP-N,N'-diacetyllegionaminic acid synthase
MKSISVVTNARLQSTRVPQKLVRPFAGKSLLEIALERLNRLDFFEHRFIAAAEEPIIEMAKAYPNVEVLRRKPEAVARGVNPQAVTFAHYREVPSDYIFVLNPCLPFVTVETIRKAFDYFQATDHASYTSVVKTGDWVFDSDGNPVTNTDPQNLTTNKNVQFYKAAHAFHIVSKKFFATQGYHWTFTRNDPHMIEIPEQEHIDVDTPIEFDFAEFMYRNKQAAR